MPSRHAHRAALRRHAEPDVLPPTGLSDLPPLPDDGLGWRNPVRGDAYERREWAVYIDHPGGSITLARVRQQQDGGFEVSAGMAFAKVVDPQAAFELAAGWAMAAARR